MRGRMGIQHVLGALALLVVVLGLVRMDVGTVISARKKTHISFWNGFTGPDGRAMLDIIHDFNREHPDIDISMQRMDWATYYNKLMVAALDRRGPQMFVIHASTLPRMVRAGFIAKATSLYTGPEAISPSDFDPYVLNQVTYGSDYVGLPLDVHPQGLYCNAKMLRAAGFSEPPKTGEEFLRAAHLMTLRKDPKNVNDAEQWGFALTLWRNNFQSLIPQFGGRYLDEAGNAELNSPANIQALEFLARVQNEHVAPPPENGLGWVGYRQNRVAMVWDGVYMLGDLKRLDTLEYVAAPIPQVGPKPGTMADSHVLCMRKDLTPDERRAAETFIRYLSAHSIRWADAGQVPARRSVRASPEFARMAVQSQFAKQVPHVLYPPRTPVLFELTLEIDLAVEKVIRGRTSAKEALDLANTNAQRFIDRDRSEYGAEVKL